MAAAEPVTITGRAMGTGWSVKFFQPPVPLDRDAVSREVAALLEKLEQQFSTYRPQSELSRFNASDRTDWIAVAPELAFVAAESRRISELTGGAFDVTVLPLVALWGFGPGGQSGTIPSAKEIAAARQRVDWRRLEVRLEPPALRKLEPRVEVDFSSMAKGFAADAVSQRLTALGAPQYLVQVGGDVRAGAAATGAAGWPIAIEQPLDVASARSVADVIRLAGRAVSTSGDHRNSFRVGRKRYGHIIDPRTGKPVDGDLASVSVVHDSCATSSALATALFVLGADEGFRLATRERLACLFLLRDGAGIVRRPTHEFERLLRP